MAGTASLAFWAHLVRGLADETEARAPCKLEYLKYLSSSGVLLNFIAYCLRHLVILYKFHISITSSALRVEGGYTSAEPRSSEQPVLLPLLLSSARPSI